MAFCFLVNVNQCLNMDHYRPFFYKKVHTHEMCVCKDSCLGSCRSGVPFDEIASDIQMQLDCDRRIRDYQIVIAIRDQYAERAWGETLLSKLLTIDYELRNAGIILKTGKMIQMAVSIIMLYEANGICSIDELRDEYLNSDRLRNETKLMLSELGITEARFTRKTLEEAIEFYKEKNGNAEGDFGNAVPLIDFITDVLEKNTDQEFTEVFLSKALTDLLNRYLVFELLLNDLDRDYEEKLLKIVDYVNDDFAELSSSDMQLQEKCAYVWKEIEKEKTGDKYAEILWHYQKRLEGVFVEDKIHKNERKPEMFVLPDDKQISLSGEGYDLFEKDGEVSFDERRKFLLALSDEKQDDPEAILDTFQNKIKSEKSLMPCWDSTFERIKEILDFMDESLTHYSNELSSVFAEELRKRKEEERKAESNTYWVDTEEERKVIGGINKEKSRIMQLLDQPQMSPALQIQDSLNMRKVLEQENINITHYIACIDAATRSAFFILLVVLCAVTALLYALGQLYVFSEIQSVLVFSGYILLTVFLMFIMQGTLFAFYRHKIAMCVKRLREGMDKYIEGYFQRAHKFHEHINYLNQLDYSERQLSVRKKIVEQNMNYDNLLQWHKMQIEEHLKKLVFFQAIMKLYNPSDAENHLEETDISMLKVFEPDVSDSKLYWPQMS